MPAPPPVASDPITNRRTVLRESRCLGMSTADVEESLGVQLVYDSAGVFVRDSLNGGKLLGQLKLTFAGSTIQAVCECHRGCKGLISAKPKLGLQVSDVEVDLLAWLGAGPGCGVCVRTLLKNA